jgi:putative redox protein
MKRIASAVVATTAQNYRQRIATGGFDLVADEPVAAGGQNAGPAPYQFLLASLGACTTITLKMYADRKGWDIGEMKVSLTLSKDADGSTFVARTLDSTARLTAEQWDRLLDIAGKTPVTRTLLTGTRITTAILERTGGEFEIKAATEAALLVLSGEPIPEPVVGYGPFVMTSQAEFARAIRDHQTGRFGRLSANS